MSEEGSWTLSGKTHNHLKFRVGWAETTIYENFYANISFKFGWVFRSNTQNLWHHKLSAFYEWRHVQAFSASMLCNETFVFQSFTYFSDHAIYNMCRRTLYIGRDVTFIINFPSESLQHYSNLMWWFDNKLFLSINQYKFIELVCVRIG